MQAGSTAMGLLPDCRQYTQDLTNRPADRIDWAVFVFQDQSLARASVREAQRGVYEGALLFQPVVSATGVFQERKHCPTC